MCAHFTDPLVKGHKRHFIAFKYDYLAYEICQRKKVGKDKESIQSNTTPDPGYKWENDNLTTRYHKRETNDQPPHPSSRRPQGTNKQMLTKAQQKQDRNNINDKKKTPTWNVSKNISLEGLNRFKARQPHN